MEIIYKAFKLKVKRNDQFNIIHSNDVRKLKPR